MVQREGEVNAKNPPTCIFLAKILANFYQVLVCCRRFGVTRGQWPFRPAGRESMMRTHSLHMFPCFSGFKIPSVAQIYKISGQEDLLHLIHQIWTMSHGPAVAAPAGKIYNNILLQMAKTCHTTMRKENGILLLLLISALKN